MLFAWLLIPCVLLCCAHAFLWWRGRRARKMFKGLPSYPPLPFIGNLHQIFGDGPYLFQVINNITKMSEEAGLPFAAWIGPSPLIVVMEPDDVKTVTNAFTDKPYYYNFAKDWVGNGLVTAPSYIWKRSIKKLAGTFTGSIVDGYQDVFNAQAQRLVENLKGEVGGEPFNLLHKYLAYTTLESFCQTALGINDMTDSIVTREYYSAFNRTFELFVERGMNIFLHLDCVYKLTPGYKEMMRCVAVMQRVSISIMKKRMQEREAMKKNGTLQTTTENSGTKFKAFLDILFDLQEADPTMTDQQVRAEVDTIIVGGQETVATTLFMTLLILGSRPDVQDKLYAEMKEIFGDSKRAIQKEDLVRMEYCECVLYETLRLYPPIPFIMRNADRDLPLKSCTIPKGAACGVNAWGAGRSKKYWGEDAGAYRPERWMNNDLARMNSTNFLSFSYGKRACIGKRYAMSIMKTILAWCIRELRFTSEFDKLKLKFDITLKAASGELMNVHLRD